MTHSKPDDDTSNIDPSVADEVARAMEPYRGVMPPEVQQTMEEILTHALLTHPIGSLLMNRVKPRAERIRSGVEQADGSAAHEATKKAGSK
ncbi:MAG: hypothetical protein IPK82_27855 [Polyangiaceae bacterium]|nr:hypothetical protein [Polyangiaceae bacterium]